MAKRPIWRAESDVQWATVGAIALPPGRPKAGQPPWGAGSDLRHRRVPMTGKWATVGALI